MHEDQVTKDVAASQLPAIKDAAHLRTDNRGLQDKVRTAYLFQCGDEELFAVTPDANGGNIPRSSCTQGWQLREAFQLGATELVPTAISPQPVLRGITEKGYYIWRAG